MQRQDSGKSPTKSSELEPPSLDAVLAKSDDKELFYTASVHFLQKRLQEKSHKLASQPVSRSCCNLNNNEDKYHKIKLIQSDQSDLSFDSINAESDPLSMHQLLPFPKSRKESLITRLMNTFRKHRQHLERLNDAAVMDDTESKSISNFKFPRCERFHKISPSSGLLQISEEHSDVSSKHSSSSKIAHIAQSDSKCSVAKVSNLDQQSFR